MGHLERLADLIRPALSWRPGSSGDKPAGAFDGRSFTATQAMTSLTGSAGEDFASILRALGYRMEKRPALPKPAPVVETPAAEASPPEAVSETAPETVSETVAPETLSERVLEAAEAAPTEAVAAVAAETGDITSEAPPSSEEAAPAPSASVAATRCW